MTIAVASTLFLLSTQIVSDFIDVIKISILQGLNLCAEKVTTCFKDYLGNIFSLVESFDSGNVHSEAQGVIIH